MFHGVRGSLTSNHSVFNPPCLLESLNCLRSSTPVQAFKTTVSSRSYPHKTILDEEGLLMSPFPESLQQSVTDGEGESHFLSALATVEVRTLSKEAHSTPVLMQATLIKLSGPTNRPKARE